MKVSFLFILPLFFWGPKITWQGLLTNWFNKILHSPKVKPVASDSMHHKVTGWCHQSLSFFTFFSNPFLGKMNFPLVGGQIFWKGFKPHNQLRRYKGPFFHARRADYGWFQPQKVRSKRFFVFFPGLGRERWWLLLGERAMIWVWPSDVFFFFLDFLCLGVAFLVIVWIYWAQPYYDGPFNDLSFALLGNPILVIHLGIKKFQGLLTSLFFISNSFLKPFLVSLAKAVSFLLGGLVSRKKTKSVLFFHFHWGDTLTLKHFLG